MSASVFAILGATGGIGSALADRLVRQGARVALAGRREDAVASQAERLETRGWTFDATDVDAVAGFLDEASDWGGGLAGVASCVGSILLKPAHLTSPEEFEDVLRVNLVSAFAVVRAAAATMGRTGGSVVLVGTAAVEIGLANHEAIAAAKGGVAGLVRSAAATYAARGIRVNGVAPGLVETPMTRRITGNDLARKASIAMHPLGRIGKPDDVASAIAWLLDPANDWITGQMVGVDGGLATLKTRARA